MIVPKNLVKYFNVFEHEFDLHVVIKIGYYYFKTK